MRRTAGCLAVAGLVGLCGCGGDDGPTAADASPPDASLPDAPPEPDAMPQPPAPFIEDFTSLVNIDTATTDAIIDTAGTGAAQGRSIVPFRTDIGAGTAAYAPVADASLAAGVHEFTDMTLSGPITVTVDGDAQIHLTGSLIIQNGARLQVMGNLTVVAGNDVWLDCGRIDASGTVETHAIDLTRVACFSGSAPTDGMISTTDATGGDSGSVRLWGTNSVYVGPHGSVRTGNVTDAPPAPFVAGVIDLASNLDVQVTEGEAVAGTGPGGGGGVRLRGQYGAGVGTLSVVRSGACTGDEALAGDIEIKGGVSVGVNGGLDTAIVEAAPGGSVEMEALGDECNLSPGAHVSTAPALGRAGDIRLTCGGFFLFYSDITAGSGGSPGGGNVHVTTTSYSSLTGGTIRAGDGLCGAGGSIDLLIGEGVTLEDSYILAGNGLTDAVCALPPGGSVSIRSATYLEGGTMPGPYVLAGAGDPVGTTTIVEVGGPFPVDVASTLFGTSRVESTTLTLPRAVLITGFTEEWVASPLGTVLVSPTGNEADFVPAGTLVNGMLQPGWRYRVNIPVGLFTASRIEGFRLDLE